MLAVVVGAYQANAKFIEYGETFFFLLIERLLAFEDLFLLALRIQKHIL
jgi:hypothetical protein